MKETFKTIKEALQLQNRAAKLLHKVSPNFFPVATLYALVSSLIPYVTVYFSAQLLQELSNNRRPEILIRWAMAATLCGGIFLLLRAFLYQRYNTLQDALYASKEILFSHKFFSMDYKDLDSQKIRDLHAQIQQNENWSSWGLMRASENYQIGLCNLLGILSGILLTISLFTAPVPQNSGWLTILNHPVFVLILASCILMVSLLAGMFSAKAVSIWGQKAETMTLINRIFGYFGKFGQRQENSEDVRLYQ